jgi:hypothetical protein
MSSKWKCNQGYTWRKEDGRHNGGFICNDESSSKHWVLFYFACDFEKVLKDDVGHGGMNIKCCCYFELECHLCVLASWLARSYDGFCYDVGE